MMKTHIVDPSLRVCVCTSYSAASEPRAPRHARAIAELDHTIEVTFIDCLPFDAAPEKYDPFEGIDNIVRVTHRYAHRRARPLRLVLDKIAKFASRFLFRWFGVLSSVALDTRMRGFEALLRRHPADVYVGHNIECLLPINRVAQVYNASTIFDAMEFYSDMSDSQMPLDRDLVRQIEKRCLPQCALVLSTSRQLSDALAREYQIQPPVALGNVPAVNQHVHRCDHEGLRLYWRNAVLGFGQRGLQIALEALSQIPSDISLHLQGRLPLDGGCALRERIEKLSLVDRVFVHPPYSPPLAVAEASRFCVGLCLEERGVRNHELTVSNKIYDYLMGGLVVIASDLPGLRDVIERSRGGLLFTPGDAADLAKNILKLRDDVDLRFQLAANARNFALREGNRGVEMKRFKEAFSNAVCLKTETSTITAPAA